MWIFFFAAQLLPMLNPILCSHLMSLNMENFVYMNITTTVLGLAFIPVMKASFNYVKNKGKLLLAPVK